MRLIKRIAAMFGLSILLTVPLAATASAQNQVFQACSQPGASNSTLCQSVGQTGNQQAGSNSLYGPNGIITKIVRILSQVIGFIAVIMIIVGGLKYILSQGDSNNVNSAKNTILYAVIGLVVAIMGQAIVIFVLNRVA